MDRVIVGRRYADQPVWKRLLGIPLIYLPLVTTIPFLIIGVALVSFHLKYIGAVNVRSYWSFVPSWVSHRYRYDTQITYHTDTTRLHLRAYRWFWIFNCKVYCPMSVALFRYSAYLVGIVENWWCPFHHDKKSDYSGSAIDRSYWHIHEAERQLLHPDDRYNSIWNEETDEESTPPPV